ncbi:MAG: PA14 domain-containing protein [Lentisphaeraceae bacterium]|nr:PA14 domain-containing protein [Lentisphaeraceae bacterium]
MRKVSLALMFCVLFTLPVFAEKSGKEAYEISCLKCHGANGAGGNDHLQGPNITILKKDYFMAQFKAIRDGVRKGPGTVNMLKVLAESKLSEKEIMAAAAYAEKLPEARANHKKFGDAKKGQAKYVVCLHCHGDKAQGYTNPALPAPRLVGQSDFYIVDMLKSFKAGHRGNDTPGGMQMKAMSMTLTTEDDLKNVAAYIRSFEPKPAKVDISNLTFKVYEGKWKNLPDFSKLKAVKDGQLSKGKFDIKVAELKDSFAMVFEGELNVPKDGSYKFSLSSDDGSALFIDGKRIILNDGIHPASKVVNKSLKLKKGKVAIKAHYFEGTGGEEFNVWWNGPGVKNRGLSTTGGKKKKGGNAPPIEVDPINGEAIVLRNFIDKTSARGIAVGYPEQTNITFDATNMNLATMWKGKFLDAGAMWNGRGTKVIYPTKDESVQVGKDLQFAKLASAESKWPAELTRSANERRTHSMRFRGYKLDKKRYPTFMYTLDDISFEDFLKPVDSNGTGIIREINLSSAANPDNLWFRVSLDAIKQDGELFDIIGKYKVKAEGAVIRQFGSIQELMIPVKFEGGKAKVKVTYLFNNPGLKGVK